ncbi:hypothetical protein [Streptacidiphilus sp. P02-A3a]|uniref:hypothetical protein n=1 Tax=Streptacidiphilus sp. P02-A3a TaxID=2704468 RepID=UPI0015F7C394|nr:hypothetical protein [Streptacidiphilus sp. P02-A3a]QMU69911.1 hypothetical protein GXP74_18490 [Streptacidiphilus sp. P02-A3a]
MDRTDNTINGGDFHDPVVMAQTAHVHFHGQRRSIAKSALVTVRHYVNHTDVRAKVDAVWQDCRSEGVSTRILLTGVPGIGTTAVVARWLKDHQDDLPQEYLHAFLGPDRSGRPVDPLTVLESWLDLLQVPKAERPRDPVALAGLFRSRTSGGAVVVVIENAQSAAQVVPLLPGSDDSVVLITSHRRLAGLSGLHNVEVVRVGPLNLTDSDELLVRVGRLTATTRAARTPFVRACGGVPLALRIVADQLGALEPEEWEGFAARLANRRTRLDAMQLDEVSLPQMLDVVYQGLAPEHAEAYRLVGLNPTSAMDRGAFEALTAATGEEAAQLIGALRGANLLEQEGDMMRLNDLVHEHAWQKAAQDESGPGRDAALDRIIEYYTRCAEEAEAAQSTRWRYDAAGGYQRISREREASRAPVSAAIAVGKLARLGSNVLAALELAHRSGRHVHAWRIGQGLWTYCLRGGLHTDWIAALDTAVDAALESGDLLALARMHYERGFAHQDRFSTEHDDARLAREDLDEALRLTRAAPEPRSQAYRRTESSALEGLALLELRLGRPEHAKHLADQAMTALDGIDHPRGRALLISHLGRILTALEDFPAAQDALHSAGEQFASLPVPDRYNQGRTLQHLAACVRAAGSPAAALAALAEAEPLLRPTPYQLAELLLLRGDIHRQLGELAQAVAAWAEARDAFTVANSARVSQVDQRLADAEGASGNDDVQ